MELNPLELNNLYEHLYDLGKKLQSDESTASGAFVVPQDKRVEGSHVIQANALVGYALTEYPDGLEGDPAHLPWVDNYIAHFKLVIAPSCDLASLPTNQVCILFLL